MGDLFFNKIAAALLTIFLIILGLTTLRDVVFDTEAPETPAYPIDLSILEAGNAAEAEEEGPIDFGLLLASADIGAGERVARRCAACHTFDEGGADGTGPHMWGVMGRVVASVAGFGYSNAMNDYGSDGKAWDYENMYNYLENPRSYVSGTAMSFAGLRNQDDRINIIAYMRSLSSDPIALPEPLPVAEATAAIEAMVDGAAMDDATEGMSEEGQALLESVMDAAGVDPEGTDAEIAAAAQEAEATVEDAASDAATEAVDAVEDASEETDN
jgi:cytochrome c